MKKIFQLLVGLLLSIIFLYVALRNVDLDAMWKSFNSISAFQFSLALMCVFFMQMARWVRWMALTNPLADITVSEQFKISVTGSALIALLPMRLGEFARPLLLRQMGGVAVSSSLAAAAVERILDGLVISGIFFASVTALPDTVAIPLWLDMAAWGMLGGFLGVALVLLGLLFLGDRLEPILQYFSHWVGKKIVDKIIDLIRDFRRGLEVLHSAKAIVLTLGSTTLFWLANTMAIAILLNGFDWNLPPAAPWLLSCIMVLGVMVPAGPGFLGTFQGAVLVGLSIFSINPTDAAAFGLAFYLALVGMMVGLALPFLPLVIGQMFDLMRSYFTSAQKSSELSENSLI